MTAPLKSAAELVAEHRGDDEDSAEIQTDNPKAQKTYTFKFEHRESGTNKLRRGTFTNNILTIRGKRMVGVMQSQLAGGMPWGTLSPFDQNLIMMLAHLSVSLDREKRPKWAKDLEALYDDDLIEKLYEEVADHEATFHGLDKDQEEGEGDSREEDPDGGPDGLAPGEASAP